MTMKYRPVPISKLVVETPEPLHGDTTANPIPAPKESRRSVSAKEATAPAATAGPGHSRHGGLNYFCQRALSN
jgi:hypothetical protein